jgi:hypothetical protein
MERLQKTWVQPVKTDDEEWSTGEEPMEMNEEQQRRYAIKSAERMRYLLELLPSKIRY